MKKGTILVLGLIGITLLAGLSLSGCVTAHEVQGREIEKGTVRKIEKGKTTKNEILKWFGLPDKTIEAGASLQANGKNQEIYVYEYSETEKQFGVHNSRAERKNTLMIWIDKDSGIVQDYGYKKEI